jgi:hypothetical protein
VKKNLVSPLPLGLTLPKHKPRPKIGGQVFNGNTVIYESDLNLPGIIPGTNNYPPSVVNPRPIYYFFPTDYYDTEGDSTYFEILYE